MAANFRGGGDLNNSIVLLFVTSIVVINSNEHLAWT